jgi:hypothetical protein
MYWLSICLTFPKITNFWKGMLNNFVHPLKVKINLYFSVKNNHFFHLNLTHMKKKLSYCVVFFFTFIALEGCISFPKQMPISTKPSANNKDYKVSFLFEHDGCKVYRFEDRGEFIYFTSCNGETMKTQTDTLGVKRMQSMNKN